MAVRKVKIQKETKFVGRSIELAQIKNSLRNVADGGFRVVGVIGEPGTGKSRLVRRVTEDLDDFDFLTGFGRRLSEDQPFYLLQDVLVNRYPTSQDLSREADELGMSRHESNLLERLFGSVDYVGDLSNDLLRRRLSETFINYMKRMADKNRKPTVLVVEDAHWMDDTSAAVVNKLARDAPGRLGIVYANRSTEALDKIDVPSLVLADNLALAKNIDLVVVEPFTDTEAMKIVTQFGVSDPKVIAKAEGIPIRLEYLAIARGEDLDLDLSLGDLINMRIDNVGEGARLLMEAATVLNGPFERGLIQEMLHSDDIFPDSLVNLRLLKRIGKTRYGVDHDTVASAVSEKMDERLVLSLNSSALRAYRKLYSSDAVVERLVYHANNIGRRPDLVDIDRERLREDVVDSFLVAGRKARALGVANLAETRFRKALDYVGKVPDRRAGINMEFCNLLYERGDVRFIPEMQGLLDFLAPLDCGDETRYRAAFGDALMQFEKGNFSTAIRDLDWVGGIVNFRLRSLNDSVRGREMNEIEKAKLASLNNYLFRIALTRGRIDYVHGLVLPEKDNSLFRSAKFHYEEAERFLKGSGDDAFQAILDINLALVGRELLDIDDVVRRLDRSRELCERDDLVVLTGYHMNADAIYRTFIGEYDAAAELLERGLEFASETDFVLMRLFMYDSYGDLASKTGDYASAKEYYGRALDIIRDRGRMIYDGDDDEKVIGSGDVFGFSKMLRRKIAKIKD